MKAVILFYSMYGHIHALAEAVAKGAGKVPGVEPKLLRVPETLPPQVLEKMGAVEPAKAWAGVPVAKPADLEGIGALFIGTPTRFGGACGQMRQFLDATGGLWVKGALLGRVGAGFTCSGTQHGGQEMTIVGSLVPYFLHHGMLVAGLPYAYEGQSSVEGIVGGSPYGASTIAGPDGDRAPGALDLGGAEYLGEHVARLAKKLHG